MNQDKINQRIQALESELARLKAELTKPEKFEFKYPFEHTFLITENEIQSEKYGSTLKYLENFRYRQTESNAKVDFQLQKELMCIGALAEQIDPDYKSKVIWDERTYSYYIWFSLPANKYFINAHTDSKILGVVYMPKDVAEKVCKILNNKQVEL